MKSRTETLAVLAILVLGIVTLLPAAAAEEKAPQTPPTVSSTKTQGQQQTTFPGRYRQIGTVGQTYGESSEIREITTGALAIEIFDQASARRLWTGYATTGMTMDVRINSQAETKELVAMIMDQFPPNG